MPPAARESHSMSKPDWVLSPAVRSGLAERLVLPLRKRVERCAITALPKPRP